MHHEVLAENRKSLFDRISASTNQSASYIWAKFVQLTSTATSRSTSKNLVTIPADHSPPHPHYPHPHGSILASDRFHSDDCSPASTVLRLHTTHNSHGGGNVTRDRGTSVAVLLPPVVQYLGTYLPQPGKRFGSQQQQQEQQLGAVTGLLGCFMSRPPLGKRLSNTLRAAVPHLFLLAQCLAVGWRRLRHRGSW